MFLFQNKTRGMGKIVIWNSEVCAGCMLYCMFSLPAVLEPEGSQCPDKYSWERHKVNEATGERGRFCPHLPEQRAN